MNEYTYKVTLCEYKAPRKSEKTWLPGAKWSVSNLGHKAVALRNTLAQCSRRAKG